MLGCLGSRRKHTGYLSLLLINASQLKFSSISSNPQFTVWDESQKKYITHRGKALEKLVKNRFESRLRKIESYRDVLGRSPGDDYILQMVVDLAANYKRPDHAFLAAQAAVDMTRKDKKWTGIPFAELFPALLWHYQPGFASPLTSAVERLMDNHSNLRSHHPNMSEFLGLLNHPQLPIITGPTEALDDLTQTITSIPHWLNRPELEVNLPTVLNWQKLGFLTHAFRFWRFDCQRWKTAKNSNENLALIERSPFELRRVENRQTDKPSETHPGFGPGYVMIGKPETINIFDGDGKPIPMEFDKRTWIEMRRGYILVSHPTHGTLIIRNSSHDFGRDGLSHPVYWRRDGLSAKHMSKQELLDLTPDVIEKRFSPITKPNINRPELKLDEHVDFLLKHFIGIKHSLDNWKFGTNYYTSAETLPTKNGGVKSPSSFAEEKPPSTISSFFATLRAGSSTSKSDDHGNTEVNETRILTGGPASSGFKNILDFIAVRFKERIALIKEGKTLRRMPQQTDADRERLRAIKVQLAKIPMPVLAFHHPDFPPWSPIPFETGEGNSIRKQSALKITPENFKALRLAQKYPAAYTRYLTLKATEPESKRTQKLKRKLYVADQKMRRTGVRSFLQTGINSGASLVLTSSQK